MTREDLQKLMLKQVATKINNATSGKTKRRILPAKAIPPGVIVGHSANCIELLENSMDYETLLAVLNSKLMNWIFKKTSTNNHVNVYELESLPMKQFPDNKSKEIVKIVHKIQELVSLNSFTNEVEAEIGSLRETLDRFVFGVYQLEPEDVEVIIESVG